LIEFILTVVERLQIVLVFSAFDTATLVLQGKLAVDSSIILLNIGIIVQNILMLCTIVHAGSQTTQVAERNRLLLMKRAQEEDEQKILMLMQIQSRNLNIQNDFFKINWSVLTRVSGWLRFERTEIEGLLFPDAVDACNLPGDLVSVRVPELRQIGGKFDDGYGCLFTVV
jgi:hypothetical protein